jgi:myo-inositol 2-dehydrogenase/D-chiro-inositol 1-dehydrogenase
VPARGHWRRRSLAWDIAFVAHDLQARRLAPVRASGACLIDAGIGTAGDVDTSIVMLKLESGALAVIDNSRQAVYGYDQRIEVFGSAGAAAVSNDTPSSAVLSTADGVLSEKPKYFFLERYKDSFIAEEKDFFDAVLNDRETSVTGMDGLKPVLIGLAAKRSFETGMPVKVG